MCLDIDPRLLEERNSCQIQGTCITVPLGKLCRTGSVLIARSAARRLAVNFEGKTEVILDFDGIDELMQPFAHELFTVWHRQHPDVKITCVNTNEQIDRQRKRHKDQE